MLKSLGDLISQFVHLRDFCRKQNRTLAKINECQYLTFLQFVFFTQTGRKVTVPLRRICSVVMVFLYRNE